MEFTLNGWALILGASSGFGEAVALELGRRGMNICGVHLDRRGTLHNVERITSALTSMGRQALFFNANAADEEKRKEIVSRLAEQLKDQKEPKVRVFLHSLAFGTLRPLIAPAGEAITKANLDMTSDVMGHSLVYWTQDLVRNELLGKGSRIFAMTSSGGHRIIPSYGAVSAAKAALESHIRQLAFELAPRGITANSICAGVTDTPALRKIPGNDRMIRVATERNPSMRLTTPEDVAQAISALSLPSCHWITGNVINCDGGEDIAG